MAENIFEDMLTEERSKIMAKTAGFGLADTLYRQLATDQLAQQKPARRCSSSLASPGLML
jgi:Rod binding domain-containing protein